MRANLAPVQEVREQSWQAVEGLRADMKRLMARDDVLADRYDLAVVKMALQAVLAELDYRQVIATYCDA